MRHTVGLMTVTAALLLVAATFNAQQKPAPEPRTGVGHPQGTKLQALLDAADAALARKDFPAAVKALEEFISIEPESAYVHFQLGYAYAVLERPKEAEREYARAAELAPDMAEAHLNLGLLRLDRDPAAAVQDFERAAALLPDSPRPRFLLGLALERSHRLADAVAQYRAAAALDADSFDIHFALARALLALARTAEAEAEFRKSLELRPRMPAAMLGLAESLIDQKKFDEAAATLAVYLETVPDDADSRVQFASLLLDLARDEEVLAQLRRAEESGYTSPALFSLRAQAHLRRGELEAAIRSLSRAVELRPRDAALRAHLGRLWLERRDFAAAERELIAALELEPSHVEALRDLVANFYLAGKYPQALQALELLQQREELPAGSWFIRATCYDKLGRKAEALAAYERFLALDEGKNPTQTFQAQQRARLLARELRRR